MAINKNEILSMLTDTDCFVAVPVAKKDGRTTTARIIHCGAPTLVIQKLKEAMKEHGDSSAQEVSLYNASTGINRHMFMQNLLADMEATTTITMSVSCANISSLSSMIGSMNKSEATSGVTVELYRSDTVGELYYVEIRLRGEQCDIDKYAFTLKSIFEFKEEK